MHLWLNVLLLCFIACIASCTVHVFLIIGQSNAIGFNNDGHTGEDRTDENIQQLSCCKEEEKCELILGQDPLHHVCWHLESPRVGFGMSFARELKMKLPDNDVIVLVPAGVPGSGFADGVWTAYSGSGFLEAQNRLRKSFELIEHTYPTHAAELGGILWHQGEGDTNGNTTAEDHLNKNLKPMITAWRNKTVIPQSGEHVPFVAGNMVPEWVEQPYAPKRKLISTALQELSQYVSFTAVAPSFGLHGAKNDVIHFDAPSQRLLGKRYFVAWQAAFLNHGVQGV